MIGLYVNECTNNVYYVYILIFMCSSRLCQRHYYKPLSNELSSRLLVDFPKGEVIFMI